MTDTLKTFYIFHGEDEYTIAEQVAAMRGQMDDDFNTLELDGTQTSANEVLAAVQVVPFLGDKRLVIVRGLLAHLKRRGAGKEGKAALERLVEALPALPNSARLVFWENKALADKHPVLQLAQEHPRGYVKAFNPPGNIVRWIEQQATSYGVTIQPAAAAALANVAGKDLRVADAELLKLAAYVGEGQTIETPHVSLLTAYVAEPDIFAMVDALGQRNGAQALHHLHRLLVNSQPLSLFGMMIRQFRLILMAREWMDDGGSVKDMPSALGLHPFVAKKVSDQARGYSSLDEIKFIYRHLLELDHQIKTGKTNDRLALELLISGLAQSD